jgi:hypothetical protein
MRAAIGIAAVVSVVLVVVCAALIPANRPAPDFRSARVTAESKAAQPRNDGYRLVQWSELVPAGWDVRHRPRELREGLSNLSDSDPRAVEWLARMREAWKAAPTNAKLDGVAIRIPGYVVPLGGGRELAEFLLVPYFGACIHTPPPPANQIIHVRPDRAVAGLRAMDAVWISGALHVERSDTQEGTSGYTMNGAVIERYEPNAQQPRRR